MMRVLFQSRQTLFSVPGGDTVQILKTAEALRSLGCHVDVSTDLQPDLESYDLVHLFNLIRPQEVYLQALNAKRQGKKVALSTIYVSYAEYERNARRGLGGLAACCLSEPQLEYLKVLARAVKNREMNPGTMALLSNGFKRLQRQVLDMVDILLPNSDSEMARVRADFPAVASKPWFSVPNAVDADQFGLSEPLAPEDREGVICVARIEGRKNHLNLVRAMNGLPWSLTIIGQPAPNHLGYFREVQQAAGPNVQFVGPFDHEQLPAYYRAARVHCLISWFETTGLSSLEAGVAGCNLVITDKGDTRDYFGDHAFYCEPDDVASIRSAIIRAYESPIDLHLRHRILTRYNWQQAGEVTLRGYLRALGGS